MDKDGRINIARFIERLDGCFNRNDMKAARECIEYWEAEARRLGDDSGLLTVLMKPLAFTGARRRKAKR